jgi:phage anti-repressor protein
MEMLNIVNLIESNPITKLTNVYNNKFLTKIKENFTEMEQQIFISSCYCYLNYNESDFVIDLDNIWTWLGFSQKQRAKELLKKHFTINIDYKQLINQKVKQTNGHGGSNKETIMLNIDCFKLLCIKADTKKANEIHGYFIKLEKILHQIIEEESNELKLQLENAQNTITQIEESKSTEITTKVAKEREQSLLRDYGTIGSIVYIIKVKSYETGEYIIKIGESRRGVQLRYNEHKSHYDEVLLLDCFPVKKSKDFENFIHSHKDIKFNQVTDLQGHETERELFLIGKNLTYKTLLNVINSNIKTFNEHNESDYEKLKIENETLKEIISSSKNPTVQLKNEIQYDNSILQELLNGQQQMMKKIQELEKTNKEILEKMNLSQTKTTTNFNQPLVTIGPRLQKINPESMTLIKVYESLVECLKEYNFKVKRPSIMKAIAENTVYYGFRWAYVDRNTDPNIITNIEPTKPTKIQNVGYIAKLNAEKTEIINVYLDRKVAATNNNYKSSSALDNPVKNGTITNGHYYALFDKCSDEVKNSFTELHGEPLLYKDGVGKYNSENELDQEFTCKYDLIKQLKMSDKTLAKTLDKNIIYNGSYFKSIGSKLVAIV